MRLSRLYLTRWPNQTCSNDPNHPPSGSYRSTNLSNALLQPPATMAVVHRKTQYANAVKQYLCGLGRLSHVLDSEKRGDREAGMMTWSPCDEHAAICKSARQYQLPKGRSIDKWPDAIRTQVNYDIIVFEKIMDE